MMKVTPARQALRIPVMGAEDKKRFIAERFKIRGDSRLFTCTGMMVLRERPRSLIRAVAWVQGLLGCSAAPTRREYFPVGSRFSSLKTDGRHDPAPQAAEKRLSCFKKTNSSSGVCAGGVPARRLALTPAPSDPAAASRGLSRAPHIAPETDHAARA